MLFSLNSERTFSNINKSTPENVGPGGYDIIPIMGNKKKMKAPFGTRGERSIFPQSNNESPSPCEYEPKPLKTGLAITSVFMSESNRKTFASDSNPGPTKYSHLDGWCSHPQNIAKKQYKTLQTSKASTGYVGQSDVTCYVMNEKGEWVPSRKKKKTSEDLGPGAYNPNQTQGTAIPISIGRGTKRNIFKMNESFPGPGSYTPKASNNKIPIKISSAQRNMLPNQNNGSGEPNFLDLKEWAEPEYEGTSGFKSRIIRKTFNDPDPTPAPTAYYRPPRQYISSGNGFGCKAERSSYSALNSNPGPGTYEPKVRWINKDKTLSLRKSVGRSVSSISESKNANAVPGPGKYDTKDVWLKDNMGPSSVFESRVPRGDIKNDDTPGAGSYDPRITDKDHAVPTLIRESRFADQSSWVDKNQISNPSPDYYQNVDIKPGKGKTISSTNRDKPDRDQFPGPGAYNVLHASLKTKCYNARAPQDNDEMI